MTDDEKLDRRPAPSLRKRVALLAGALCVALVVAEVGLHVLGVEIRADRIVRDAILGWRNRPGWQGLTYSINSWGCLGPEFNPRKRDGVVRVLCLGDSCTAGDLLPNFADTYPQQLAGELERRHPGETFDVIQAAVGGYSSFQGRLWLERELIACQPDVLVVYFGWNDHWPARSGGPDHVVSGSTSERLRAWLAWSKLVQLGIKGYQVAFGRQVVPAGEGPAAVASGRPARVSREDYRANLEAMAALVRKHGGQTVVITAPNYLECSTDRSDVQADTATADALVRVHASYCDVAREAARDVGACLVDAARAFVTEPDPERLFWRTAPRAKLDFIHLSALGYAKLAAEVAACDAVREAVETQ